MYSLKNKINQLFIIGFSGNNADKSEILKKLLHEGLGGVIFFTPNIETSKQFRRNTDTIKNHALISPFLSIDQEGGRVERTENIHSGKKYLSAKIAAEKGLDFVKLQTEELCDDLLSYGINMNFAPVLDTNTNPNNPIIGIRAYGNTPETVIKYATEVIKIHKQKGIIPVGKHFPGHGDTKVDSHIEMPIVDLPIEEMEQKHLKPFKEAIDKGLDAIMASHVYYTCYDKEPIPASLSKNILTNILRNKLNFNGLILSDDMVMGAVKDMSPSDSYIKGLLSGINVFLYRYSDEKLIQILNIIEENAKKNEKLKEAINTSFEKVVELKQQYSI